MSNAFDDTQIDAIFELNDEPQLDAVFDIYAAGTTWGSIDGNLSNQTDLKDALDSKADVTTVEAISETVSTNTTEIATINATLTTYGDIVTHNVDEFATAAQGELADTALQPNDNISELINDAGYITGIDSSDVTGALGYTPYNATNPDGFITGIDGSDVTTALGYTPQPELTAGANIQINNNTISATDTTYSAGSGINISGTTISTDTTIASKTDIGNASLTIYGNNTSLGTFTANATSNVSVTVPIPTTATEVGALPSDTTIEDLTSAAQQAALNSGATSSNISAIATNTSHINEIYGLIPNDASTANQLTTEAFVNSSISTNTANFIGTFNSVAELEAYSGTLTNNDYAFVATEDAAGNTLYDRYKWNGTEWLFEYELNNSSFTSDQWAAINSGVTAGYVTQIATNTSAIAGKQDTLTAGSNITISGNTISATDTTYNAGNGINISGGTISTDTTIASKTDIGAADITIQRNGTAIGTINANATSASTINISVPATATDIGALPSSTVIGDGKVIFQKNSTSIATVSANQTSTTTVNFTIPTQASDINALPDTTTIGAANTTIQVNSTAVGTVNANATSDGAINISVPTNTNELTNGAGYITSSALTTYQLIAQDMASLSASGSISLSDNTINKISAIGSVTFTLPSVTDLTKFHQILVQLYMSSAQTINLGTTYYFNSTAPDLSNAGTYNLYFEYDNTASHWVAGCLGKGAAS